MASKQLPRKEDRSETPTPPRPSGAADVLEDRPIARRIQRDDEQRWVIRAPAKLNLGLRIFPPRQDGFHDLETWMVPLSWHDTLTVTLGVPLELLITGRAEGVPTDLTKNLVGRAALKLAKETGIEPHGRIELHKVLPPGGGLGGGSSDAANAMVLLNDAWNLNLSHETLARHSAELGSDVPFFVRGVPSLCTGRGEICRPMRPYHTLFAVLILPSQGLATKPVYEAFDQLPPRESPSLNNNGHGASGWCHFASLPAGQLNDVLFNDLESPAFSIAPWLNELKERAATAIGQKVHMTGSGSTLFTLSSSASHLTELYDRLSTQLPRDVTCVNVRLLRRL